jgi:uncharacterized membrane protein
MRGKIALLLALVVLVSINIVSAATIQGTVYNLDLSTANDAIVEINTNPNQILLVLDGDYSFDVPTGEYVLKASKIENGQITDSTTELITVPNDGTYTIDLILFPDLGGLEDLDDRTDVIDQSIDEENGIVLNIILTIIGVLILALIIRFIMKKTKGEPVHTHEDEEEQVDLAEAVLDFIKKQEGRTTQKEIRKNFPQSEAKISLVVSELVHKEKIEKIKKGRANIIVLKK